jgi:translation elongation factor EF-G/predicted RNA-binding protein with PIN domain
VLVISGTDGVQSHTETLWRLLRRYHVPVFLFVNKMDLGGADREAVLDQLRSRLEENILPFDVEADETWLEELGLCDEALMEEYLDTGSISPAAISAAVEKRSVFPCCFGSALRLEGVDRFLQVLEDYAPRPVWPEAFAARVFKIARDAQGARLTYLKVTGGSLKVRDAVSGVSEKGEAWTEKADQLRLYSGAKFTTLPEATAGTVCAVTGLSHTRPGMGLGAEQGEIVPALEPVLTYQMLLGKDEDPHRVHLRLKELEEEDPLLHLVWNEELQQIHVQLMGQVQLEILQALILERFGLRVSFGPGSIVYRETITAPAVGIGHFEPLRHYAEVHLLLEPGEPGSGVVLDTVCSQDVLDLNWQRLIFTHLEEKEHKGVLIGAPLTDVKITLLTGRAHIKHTEGGDFRQATYRAVRNGLMQTESQLLEPWYQVRLELPQENLGRGMSDLQQRFGELEDPVLDGETALLEALVPVAALGDYAAEVASYTRGRGRLSCALAGYRPCHNQAEVVEAAHYDPTADLENTPDSVFCSHGAGTIVPWDQVKEHAHLDTSGVLTSEEPEPEEAPRIIRRGGASPAASDRELQSIFERTYGPMKDRSFRPTKKPARESLDNYPEKRIKMIQDLQPVQEYLLVDGYNIIFAWEELKKLSQTDLDAAREALIDILCNYQGYAGCGLILVFDAYKVKNNPGSVEKRGGIYVVYTKQAETADMYIEKTTYEIARHYRVRVATSDALEQVIILGHGAVRVSARMLRQEVEQAEGEIRRMLERYR